MPEVAPTVRPALELDFIIKRAGNDGEKLSVEFEIAARNSGEATAQDIRLHVELRTAGIQLDGGPTTRPVPVIDRPMVAPFALEPGGDASFAATAVLPVARIERLMLEGRPMFVPIIALAASYRWDGGGTAELGVDYLLGLDRPGHPRMAPFWLDVPQRLYDRIAVRVHGKVRKR